jgi:ABC-type transport system involved in multi-copper enzyme maturation permease subunit
MKAEAHLEVYRRFQGKLEEPRWRAWPIFAAGLQVALKQRKALLFLFAPIVIATIVFSVIVYLTFVAEAQLGPDGELPPAESIGEMAGRAFLQAQIGRLLEVVTWMIEFIKAMGFAATLLVAWFGSGLLCEDKKAGAHQLYFARPITRLDYFLGKFATASFFSLCAILAPLLVISIVAAVSSPDWLFLKEQWDVIPRAVLFALVWTVTIVSLVLLASSLAGRRSFAMIGVFALMLMSEAVSGLFGGLVDSRFFALGLVNDLNALCYHIFDKPVNGPDVSQGLAWASIVLTVGFSWLVIGLRIRRMEVVA